MYYSALCIIIIITGKLWNIFIKIQQHNLICSNSRIQNLSKYWEVTIHTVIFGTVTFNTASSNAAWGLREIAESRRNRIPTLKNYRTKNLSLDIRGTYSIIEPWCFIWFHLNKSIVITTSFLFLTVSFTRTDRRVRIILVRGLHFVRTQISFLSKRRRAVWPSSHPLYLDSTVYFPTMRSSRRLFPHPPKNYVLGNSARACECARAQERFSRAEFFNANNSSAGWYDEHVNGFSCRVNSICSKCFFFIEHARNTS